MLIALQGLRSDTVGLLPLFRFEQANLGPWWGELEETGRGR